MGARLYIPTLGRFLSVDPVEGGTDNNYAYVNDPVNGFDLDGNAGWFNNIRKSVQMAAKWTWRNRENILAIAGVAACIVGTAGACLGIAVAGAVVAGHKDLKKSKSVSRVFAAGVLSGARDFAIGAVSSRLAGAKHVVRYFGTVKKNGVTRHYRNFSRAIVKKPVQIRIKKQIRAGVYGWIVQQVWR